MADFFQINPATGRPYSLEEALRTGLPQGTPGIGDGDPRRQPAQSPMKYGAPQVEPTGLAGVLQGQSVPTPERQGGGLKNILMGALGGALDGVARWGGAAPGYANAIEQQREQALADQENQRQLAIWREKLAAEREQRMRPQVEQIGNQIGLVDPETGQFSPTYTAPERVVTGEQERLISAWEQEQDPTKKALIERAIRGYQYTPEALQQREASQIRVKQAIPGKAPSVGGGGRSTGAKLPAGFILD